MTVQNHSVHYLGRDLRDLFPMRWPCAVLPRTETAFVPFFLTWELADFNEETFRSACPSLSSAKRSALAGFISQPKCVSTPSRSPRFASCFTHVPLVPNSRPASDGVR